MVQPCKLVSPGNCLVRLVIPILTLPHGTLSSSRPRRRRKPRTIPGDAGVALLVSDRGRSFRDLPKLCSVKCRSRLQNSPEWLLVVCTAGQELCTSACRAAGPQGRAIPLNNIITMPGRKGMSSGGKSSGGKTSATEGQKKQQSHSARAGYDIDRLTGWIDRSKSKS